MKKTLALLLAVAFAVPAFAGNIFSNVETYGEIETIGATQTYDAGAKTVANQTLFGMSMDLVEDVRANITFAYMNTWENPMGDSIDTYLNSIGVTEANVVVSNVFGALELKVGRQYYGNEDSTVMYFGPRHNWYSNVRSVYSTLSLDGILATWSNDSLAISGFYTQLDDYTDTRATGLTLDYAINNNLVANAYWYDLSNLVSDHFGIWGGKVAYQSEGLKLAVEGAKNYTNGVFSHNNEGWMVKADAAINLDTEDYALTPRITYYHSEKDFAAFGNYTAGILLGNQYGAFDALLAADRNWKVLNAGIDLGVKALEKVTFAFDYLNAKLDNQWLGNEFDLTAKYQHNDYVTFTLGGGVVTNLPNDMDDIYGAQIGMLIKF